MGNSVQENKHILSSPNWDSNLGHLKCEQSTLTTIPPCHNNNNNNKDNKNENNE